MGDAEGTRFEDGRVVTPSGFRAAYEQLIEGGWHASPVPEEEGGIGLSTLISQCIEEMGAGANIAFQMFHGFTASAIHVVRLFGESWLANLVNPKLVAGKWSATMCLTEPEAGSDLTNVRTRAVVQADGTYRISGSKIFISAADHDLTDNIVHIVLARARDLEGQERPGLAGLNVFAVPKWSFRDGARNGVEVVAIEHKMGLHGNPTCAVEFENAVGHLLAPGKHGSAAGMAPLFEMMNHARLSTGIGALGVAAAAMEMAHQYATERRSGRAMGSAAVRSAPADPIILHPDVRRMVMSGWAFVEGGRAMISWTALLIEEARHHPDPDVRQESALLAQLLTPIIKAFLTDHAHAVCDDCIQIHGGHGYVRETGIEQFVRDVRITRIYEGANGIQAQDLVMRRMTVGDGMAVRVLLGQIDAFLDAQSNSGPNIIMNGLKQATMHLEAAVALANDYRSARPDILLTCSTDLLELFGLVLVGWRLAVSATIARHVGEELFTHKRLLAEQWAVRHAVLSGSLLERMKCANLAFDAGDASTWR
ncbi:acyl-CoA dehydrogenase [Sphingobium sp.]|uniref:acyl-CoA dehydrogenase n=1 Tax=Sphingobium sp. TaxID=1912891 RepID=UPI0039189EAA